MNDRDDWTKSSSSLFDTPRVDAGLDNEVLNTQKQKISSRREKLTVCMPSLTGNGIYHD